MLKKLSIACMLLVVAVSASPLLAGDLGEEGFTFTKIQYFTSAKRSAHDDNVAQRANAPQDAKPAKEISSLWCDSPEPTADTGGDDLSIASTASNYSHDESSGTDLFETINSGSNGATASDAGYSTAVAPKETYQRIETDEVSLATAIESITMGILILGGMAGLVRRYGIKS